MSKAEILEKLEDWAANHRRLEVQIEALQVLTRADCECPLLDAVYRVLNAYTRAVAEQVGDQSEWLQWFEMECEMGRAPKDVRLTQGGPFVKVRTLKQLAMVIAYQGDQQ